MDRAGIIKKKCTINFTNGGYRFQVYIIYFVFVVIFSNVFLPDWFPS